MKAKPKQRAKKSAVKNKPNFPWVHVVGTCIIALLAVFVFRGLPLPSRSVTTEDKGAIVDFPKVPGFDVVGDVPLIQFPRVPLAKIHGTLERIITERLPLVIENSPFLRWPALEKWKNTSYLSEKIPLLKHVYKNTNKHFVYEDRERSLIHMKGVVGPPLKETIDMSTKDFLSFMYQPGQKEWYYFADVIGEDSDGKYKGFEAVKEDILGWETFVVRDRHPLLPSNMGTGYEGSAHVWLGQQGVVTETHYDPTHNFYFLIRGRKRFTLSPPNNHDSVYLHPFAHPCHRQSQTHVLAVENVNTSSLFPKYGQADAVSVILEAGQMIYLPPFTLHHVEALLPSVSVNVWSPSLESDLDIIINAIPLPALLQRSSTDRNEQVMRVRGLAKYLRLVIGKALNLSTTDVAQFLDERIVQPKFAPLFATLGCADFNQSKCPQKQVSIENDVGLSGDKVSAAFRETRKRLPDWHWAALEIVLSDYVERVATFVVGLENVCSFLRCLALPSSWAQPDD